MDVRNRDPKARRRARQLRIAVVQGNRVEEHKQRLY